MALDDRDYMRERASRLYAAWLEDDDEVGRDAAPVAAPQGAGKSRVSARSRRRAWTVLALTSAFALAYLAAGDRALSLLSRTPQPEPKTSTVQGWGACAQNGLLVIRNEGAARQSAVFRISRDEISWEGYVRAGEVASVELAPGVYALEFLRPGQSKAFFKAPAMQVKSSCTTVTVTL